jgi:GNAT superfamily N-acetyltransferase
MIREATAADLPPLLLIAEAFGAEAPDTHNYDLDKVEAMLRFCIYDDNAVVYVMEMDEVVVGGIVGVVAEMWASYDLSATEVAWFVDKKYRGRGALKLLRAFEDWAESKEADYITVADIEGIANLEPLYKRKGYSKVETSYSKRV